MLSSDSLQCFLEAARLLNFRAAARAVALTPAALGQRIQQLEGQLGTRLFARTTRRVMLTEAGRNLVPYAERALSAAYDCERAGRGDLAPPPIEITLGTRHELGMSWIVPMRAVLQTKQPGLTLHLYFGSSADLLGRVRAGEIECAVGSMRITDPKLDALRLHREDYVFVGAPELLRSAPLSRASDALHHTLIDTHVELPLFSYFRAAPKGGERLRFGRVVRMGTIAAVRELVLTGEGVAVLPKYLVDGDLARQQLRRIFTGVPLAPDYFRLIFRGDDPRRSLYEALARNMATVPLQ